MTTLLKRGSLALLATAALTLAGCAGNKEGGCCDDAATNKSAAATTPAARVTTVNTVCPLSGEDFGSNTRSAELVGSYKGENVGFCCAGCAKKFDKMSDEKKSAALVAAKANKPM
jgi:hypothetical protein